MGSADEIRVLAGGEVRVWIADGGAIHLQAADPHGDPTELTAPMAREVAAALLELARQLDEE
jgi:hypothetical protein